MIYYRKTLFGCGPKLTAVQVTVTKCGRICLGNQKIHFSTVFAGHDVGLRQVEDDVWLVSFMDYDMAYFDMESHKVSALENPFGPKVLG